MNWSLDQDGVANLDGNTGQSVPFDTTAFLNVPDGPYTLTVTQPGGLPQPTKTLHFSIDRTGPATPAVLSGPPGITGPSPPFTFTWGLQPTAESSHWQLFDLVSLIAEGDVAAPGASVTVAPALAPGDRTLNFRVSLRDSLLNPSLPGSWPPFIVDQTPPGAPVAIAGPVGATADVTPSFAWQGTELGGTFEWDVTDSAGKGILGPGAVRVTAGTSVTTPSLPLAPNAVHRLTFHVRQVDPYGNPGPERTLPFTITTVTRVKRPSTRYARFMIPKAGRTVSLRPLLRWRAMNAGTTIFNLQIYDGSRKIVSEFPTGTSFRVPRGRLKHGRQYIWHVWSYIGKKNTYAARPITSFFLTKR